MTVEESPSVNGDVSNKNTFYGCGFPLLCPDAQKTLLPKPCYRAEDIFVSKLDVGSGFLGKTEGCNQKASSQEMHSLESELWGHLGPLHRLALRFKGESASRTEKALAAHSSTLAWKIPWTVEPGGLWSMGSLRVGHK